MEPGFTKIFESLLDSTVWQESKETRLVWIAMLLMKNRLHVVEASVPGLARRAGVTLEECDVALGRLMAPDPYSRTTDFEGRRIEAVKGGWKILNGEVYKLKMGPDEMREYKRVWAANKRAVIKEREKAAADGGRTAGVVEMLEQAKERPAMASLLKAMEKKDEDA